MVLARVQLHPIGLTRLRVASREPPARAVPRPQASLIDKIKGKAEELGTKAQSGGETNAAAVQTADDDGSAEESDCAELFGAICC